MPRQHVRHSTTFKRTAIKLLQVSAAYFALSAAPLPTIGHHTNFPAAPPAGNKRLAAGAWPVLGLPLPTPRKRNVRAVEGERYSIAANDEFVRS